MIKKTKTTMKKPAPASKTAIAPAPVLPKPRGAARFGEDGKMRISEEGHQEIDRAFFGMKDADTVSVFLYQVDSALPNMATNSPEAINFTVEAMKGLAPKTQLELMIASQMILCHSIGVEFLRRSINGDPEHADRGSKLLRTFAQLAEIYKVRRGGRSQKIVVKHVQVNAGQAIVGNVKTGGGGRG